MKNYGVLKGKAKQLERDSDSDPHSELLMEANGTKYRVAINVRSSRGPTEQRLVEYLIVDNLRSALVDAARALPLGFTDLRDGATHSAAIDYIRSNLFRAESFKALIHEQTGPDNDLFEKVEALLTRAIDDQSAIVYAFGESWGPETAADQYFGFTPGNGIHDIHMNQGNPPGGDNDVFQDGALFVEFPGAASTSGLFIKFQSQSWHTDELTGNPLPGVPPTPGPGPWDPVPPNSTYRLAKIVGALINPMGNDVGGELVTVLNTTNAALDLTGWKILDKNDRAELLDGKIPLGEARTFRLRGKGAQLSNEGGTISLLDARGLKVDGVAYTKADAARQGAARVLSGSGIYPRGGHKPTHRQRGRGDHRQRDSLRPHTRHEFTRHCAHDRRLGYSRD
ncbi:MAG TPA: DUF2278 family protein [Polyangiales bacterium]|nr:DUF2278 family protein [Polyangiales bacterium]